MSTPRALTLADQCDHEDAFEVACARELRRLYAENADFRATCEHLIRQTCEQIGEITALKDRLAQDAYKKAYFQLAEQVAAGQALRAPAPVKMEMPPEFFEWRAMHPSLTNLQAFLLWKEKQS